MEREEHPEEDLPFSPEPVPRHIAIIMDGNGRWAQARGKNRAAGHQAGAENVRAITSACGDWGVEYLTLYSFSSENWNRPEWEVSALMQLFKHYLRAEVKELARHNVRLRAIGDLSRLPSSVGKELDRAIAELDSNDGLTLTLAMSYGSRDEILRALKKLARKINEGGFAPEDLTEEAISAELDTSYMPDPDLLIRTAGECRLSNYLLWQLAYAEFYFAEACWPDFGREELAKAIAEYQKRLRKFGKTAEQVANERDA